MIKLTLKRRFIYTILALLPVFALLLAVELHLRAETRQWYEKKLSRNHALRNSLKIHRRSNDPLLIYELTPGAEVDRQGVHYKINHAGFRDDEFPDPKSNPKNPNEYRIVVIGDSVAWGWGVDLDDVWPQVLESSLQGQMPGKTVSVYNLAVNGYSTPQEVRILEKYGPAYQPDLVILNYVLNDPEVEDGGLSWYFEAVNRIEIVYKSKLLFSAIRNLILTELGIGAKTPGKNAMDHFYMTHNSDLFKNIEQGFGALAEISRQKNIPVLVIVTPVFRANKGEFYIWADIHHKIEKLSIQNHFDFLDTQIALAAFNSADVSLDAIHPNAVGHKVIAGAVKEKLMTKP